MFGACGMSLFRPEEYAELLALLPGLPPVTAGREVVNAALAAVNGPEPVAIQVAKAFMMYEGSAMPVFADPSSLRAYMDAAEDVLHHAQIELHYMANACFLQEGQLLEGCAKLTHIPTVIQQGVADHVCPPGFAMRLKKALPQATLQWVLSGHWGNDAMEEARVAAADMLVPRLSPNI
jgi:proline iminopeptidase